MDPEADDLEDARELLVEDLVQKLLSNVKSRNTISNMLHFSFGKTVSGHFENKRLEELERDRVLIMELEQRGHAIPDSMYEDLCHRVVALIT